MRLQKSLSFGGFSSLGEKSSWKGTRDDATIDSSQNSPSRESLGREIKLRGRARSEAIKALGDLRQFYPDFQISQHLKLVRLFHKKSSLGNFFEDGFRIFLRDLGSGEGVWVKLRALLASAMLQMIRLVGESSRGQCILFNQSLKSPQSTRWDRVGNLSIFKLLEKLEAATQSDDTIILEESELVFRSVTSEAFGGGGRRDGRALKIQNRHGSVKDILYRKKSCIDPMSCLKLEGAHKFAQNLCAPLAALVGTKLAMAKRDNAPVPPKLAKWVHNTSKAREASNLVNQLGLEPKNGPFTVDDFKLITRHFGDEFRWLIFTQPSGKPKFRFGADDAPHLVSLFAHQNHFYVITNLVAFLGHNLTQSAQVCYRCFEVKTKLRILEHRCKESKCLCGQATCPGPPSNEPGEETFEKCDCGKIFTFKHCAQSHEQLGECCSPRITCSVCRARLAVSEDSQPKQIANALKNHKKVCGLVYCVPCGIKKLPFDHRCFVRTPAPEKDNSNVALRSTIWYFDTETMLMEDKSQKTILLVIERGPRSEEERAEGSTKAFERSIYEGEGCLERFVADLVDKHSKFAHSVICAHNFSGFDYVGVFAELTKQNIFCKPLFRGTRMLALEVPVNNIVFRCTLLFVPQSPLSSFPKLFGLEGSKGTFPFGVLTKRWLAKKIYREGDDRFPRLSYFEPDSLRAEKRASLEAWHEVESKRYREERLDYNIRQELLKYTFEDCRLLRQGFQKFLESLKEKFPSLLHPMRHVSLPSLCNFAFRQSAMEKDSIAAIPEHGFQFNQSRIALAWLAHQRRRLGLVSLRTARNGEVKIAGRFVDGFGRDSEGQAFVLEFLGCRFHNCPCQQDRDSKRSDSRYKDTIDRLKFLTNLGRSANDAYPPFQVISAWECGFREDMRCDVQLRRFINSYIEGLSTKALDPRESLAGGITQAYRHFCVPDIANGQYVSYTDCKSLYPAACACMFQGSAYPLGFPEVYSSLDVRERFGDPAEAIKTRELFGLVYCSVLPPKRQLLPVLHQHFDHKLIMPLCKSCMISRNPKTCRHSDRERILTGVWTSLELEFAIGAQKYEIVDIREVWHYPQRTQSLFRKFIIDLFIDKEYCSKLPAWVSDEATKIEYANELSKFLQISVDPAKFVENSAKRSVFKSLCNSFWGYWGKKDSYDNTILIDEMENLSKLDADPNKELLSANMLDDFILVSYRNLKAEASPKSSIVAAAFTAAIARVAMVKNMSDESNRLIYQDTDCRVAICSHPTAPKKIVQLGEFVDEIEAEFPGQGVKIVKVVVASGKSWAYLAVSPAGDVVAEVCKFKGLHLACYTEKFVNIRAIEGLVKNQSSRIKVPQIRFYRNILKQKVFTTKEIRCASFTSDKRRILDNSPDLASIPFGWVDVCENFDEL